MVMSIMSYEAPCLKEKKVLWQVSKEEFMITDKIQLRDFEHIATPYKHQKDIFEKTRGWEFYGLWWEMGVGKTKPLLDTIAWQFLNKELDGALIVSDKGAYLNWPLEEVPKHFPPWIPRREAVWKSRMGKKEEAKCMDILTAQDDLLDIAYVNIEALSTQRAYEWALTFLKLHHAIMIVDESTSIKNPKALRTRATISLGAFAEYRRIATGTPFTNNPLDLFSQCEFLKPGILGHRSFSSFRSRYAIMREIKLGTRRFMKVDGFVNLQELESRIRDFSSRLLKSECLDLPEKIYETQYIELTQEQIALYRKFKEEAVVLLDSGLLTSTSAITTVEKLHQICCGHVRDDEGNINDLPNGRMESLLDLLDNIPGKVIIWAHYQRDVELIMAAIREKFQSTGQFPVDYYGKTKQDDRVTTIHHFMNNTACRWFVGSPATGGKGITLTVAHNVIYYSCGYNLEDRLQSEDRAHRIGQKQNVIYTDLTTVGTIEQKILKALRQKKELLTGMFDANRLKSLFVEDDLF